MQILNWVLATLDVPRGVHVSVEIVGWGVLAFCVAAGIYLFIKEPIEIKRARKLVAERLANPSAAFQQILDLEKKIANEEVKHKGQAEKNAKELEWEENIFNQRFPYTSVEVFRAHVEKRDHVNR